MLATLQNGPHICCECSLRHGTAFDPPNEGLNAQDKHGNFFGMYGKKSVRIRKRHPGSGMIVSPASPMTVRVT